MNKILMNCLFAINNRLRPHGHTIEAIPVRNADELSVRLFHDQKKKKNSYSDT